MDADAVSDYPFLKDVCKDLFFEFLRLEAVKEVSGCEIKNPEVLAPTVSNMILMCKESKSLSQIEESIKYRFQKKSDKKSSKCDVAMKIFHEVEAKSRNLWLEFCGKYKFAMQDCPFAKDVYALAYMMVYLNELKYLLRSKKEKNE